MDEKLQHIIARIPGWVDASDMHVERIAGLIPPVEGFDYLEFTRYLFAHDIQELRSSL